jgi:hypothetical protein
MQGRLPLYSANHHGCMRLKKDAKKAGMVLANHAGESESMSCRPSGPRRRY